MLHRLPDFLSCLCVHEVFPRFVTAKFQIAAHRHIEYIHHRGLYVGQGIEIHNRHVFRVIHVFLAVPVPECHPPVAMFALLAEQPFQL